MDVYNIVFNVIYNVLSVYVGIRVLDLFLIKKEKTWIIKICVYVAIWLTNSIIYVSEFGIWPTRISIIIGFSVASIVLYNGSWIRRIVAVIAAIGLGIIVENIIWIFSYLIGKPIQNEAIGCLSSGILELFIVVLIEKILSYDRYVILPISGYISITVLSVGSVVLGEIIAEEIASYKLSMIALSIICILNISTYYIYQKIAENYKQNMQRTILIQENEMYAKQLELLQQSQQNIRLLRHDMKNHIQLVTAYIENGQYEKALEYAQKIGERNRQTEEYVKTGNMEIDSILNYKLDHIKSQMDCEFRLYVDMPKECVISDIDLNIILGNLLDNAEEALKKASKKYLDLQIKYERKILYISVYNSYNGELKIGNNGVLHTQKKKKGHGMGINSVEMIVKKYNGLIRRSYDDYNFKTDIVIYTGNEKNEF